MHGITLPSIEALNPTCLVLLKGMPLAKTKMSGKVSVVIKYGNARQKWRIDHKFPLFCQRKNGGMLDSEPRGKKKAPGYHAKVA